jgi:uncharacterized membrane protein
MKRKILAGIVLAVFLCGCVAGIGTGEKTEIPTIGEELSDLKKALDEGAITEKEYSELKQKIMNSRE